MTFVLRRADQGPQEASSIRNKQGYIDLATQKSGSIFTTKTLRALSEQYFALQDDYNKKQKYLVGQVVEIACE